jgi:ABC-type lipoprotein release transport system permease subunit
MAWSKLWVIAWRDLGRNRRRSGLTVVAIAMGLGLLIMLNGLVAGEIEDVLANSIRLRTGHLQLRSPSYEEGVASLRARDLLADVDARLARVAADPAVSAAGPVLWANVLVATPTESLASGLIGLDPSSPVHDALRAAVVAGDFLAPDDKGGIVLGRRLADAVGVNVGDKASLTVVDADGKADTGPFTVRGLIDTGVPSFDASTVLMPLAKAQAFTGARDRASAIVVMLDDKAHAQRAADALAGDGAVGLTYIDLNASTYQFMSSAIGYYYFLDFIVMFIVAVIIANTLLMAVFERIREMGILTALGMRSRQLLGLMLLEGAALAFVGIAFGLGLGLVLVAYLVKVGIPLGEISSVAGNMALGTTLYGRFAPRVFAELSGAMLVMILLGSLYPAVYAARLEPAQALHRS